MEDIDFSAAEQYFLFGPGKLSVHPERLQLGSVPACRRDAVVAGFKIESIQFMGDDFESNTPLGAALLERRALNGYP